MTKRIAVIGAGGINSWFVQHLHDVLKVFDKKDITYVKIFDKDEVEEKNLKRGNQNFQIPDLLEQKAEVLGKRYLFDYEIAWIDAENVSTLLTPFTDVILGVDNNKTRKIVYEYCLQHNKFLLDLRAQGTQLAFYIPKAQRGMEYYTKLLFSNPDVMERKGSCQLESDVVNDHIENANKALAFFAAYCIYLKRLRGEDIALEDFKIAY